MDLSTVDQETSRLIVQLQIEDISDILCINPRRPAEVGLSSDLGVALEQYKRDLEQAHLFCHGVDIAQLLEATLNLDRDSGSVGSETNTEFLTAEESLADGWGRMTVDPVPAKHNDNESLSAECICCGLRRRGAVVATPCGHNYCGQCIITLVEKALVDESLFPPRCCKTEMTIEIVEPFLTDDQIKAFADKTIEFGTSDRTYCHQATCSAFIPTSPLGEQIATCDKCGAKTCTVCKGESHESPDCPKDTVTQDVLRLAGENGWQRCQKCNRMIELNTGCNHITCRCKAEFCYVCGTDWKTCRCALWEENRLLARAARLADQQIADGRDHGQDWGRLLQGAREFVLERHECMHLRWSSRSGSHQCDECNQNLPTYIYQCNQCQILACRRCRFNRL